MVCLTHFAVAGIKLGCIRCTEIVRLTNAIPFTLIVKRWKWCSSVTTDRSRDRKQRLERTIMGYLAKGKGVAVSGLR